MTVLESLKYLLQNCCFRFSIFIFRFLFMWGFRWVTILFYSTFVYYFRIFQLLPWVVIYNHLSVTHLKPHVNRKRKWKLKNGNNRTVLWKIFQGLQSCLCFYSSTITSTITERNAPIPEDTFWAKNRKLIILTIFAYMIPLRGSSQNFGIFFIIGPI